MMEKFQENLEIFYENYETIMKINFFGLPIYVICKKKLEFLTYYTRHFMKTMRITSNRANT